MKKASKPRVLIFHPALAPYRLDLFNALSESLDLKIVFLHQNVPYQNYDQDDLLRKLDVRVGFLTRGISILGREIRTGISAEIRDFAPELVVSHEFSPLTLQVSSYCRRRGLPHVVWTADSREVVAAEHRLRRIARSVALRRIDGLVVYSADTKALYESTFGFKGKFGICPNLQKDSVLREKLADGLAKSWAIAREYDLRGTKVLLFVGRLAAVKRIDRLIRTFASLRDELEDAVLVLVGDGPDRDRLAREVADNGIESKVIFAGHQEGQSLFAWYNLGSLFLLPSEFEPWGAVVNEALVAGMPVICSDRVGARELVNSQRSGEIVDVTDSAKFREVIRAWIDRVAPVAEAQSCTLRESLMTQGFDDAVSGFVSIVDELVGGAA